MAKTQYKLVYVDSGGTWTREYGTYTPILVETARREADQYYEARIYSCKKGKERLIWDTVGKVAEQ